MMVESVVLNSMRSNAARKLPKRSTRKAGNLESNTHAGRWPTAGGRPTRRNSPGKGSTDAVRSCGCRGCANRGLPQQPLLADWAGTSRREGDVVRTFSLHLPDPLPLRMGLLGAEAQAPRCRELPRAADVTLARKFRVQPPAALDGPWLAIATASRLMQSRHLC